VDLGELNRHLRIAREAICPSLFAHLREMMGWKPAEPAACGDLGPALCAAAKAVADEAAGCMERASFALTDLMVSEGQGRFVGSFVPSVQDLAWQWRAQSASIQRIFAAGLAMGCTLPVPEGTEPRLSARTYAVEWITPFYVW